MNNPTAPQMDAATLAEMAKGCRGRSPEHEP